MNANFKQLSGTLRLMKLRRNYLRLFNYYGVYNEIREEHGRVRL